MIHRRFRELAGNPDGFQARLYFNTVAYFRGRNKTGTGRAELLYVDNRVSSVLWDWRAYRVRPGGPHGDFQQAGRHSRKAHSPAKVFARVESGMAGSVNKVIL